MQYRHLGTSGIQLSELSYGSWVTFSKQIGLVEITESLSTAYELGVNFFDNAEAYAGGESERLMGEALKKLNFRRGSYLVSTKLYWGLHDGPNEKNTLNRKYLIEAIEGSLKRLQMDYVDLLFCHRPDPHTPIDETVWAMHDIITQGKALYWGTSQWGAGDIERVFQIAEKYHLRKPVMEQPEYNLLSRHKVEVEFADLYTKYGLGTTIWSPLASGLLTGKYLNGIPKNSRFDLKGMEWLRDKLLQENYLKAVRELQTIANDIGCSLSQMALAWCLTNPRVSTVITGATSIAQLKENIGAAEQVKKLTPQYLEKIKSVVSAIV